MLRHQDGAPSKNIYTLTDDGLEELKRWLLSATDEPFFKKQILIKLALARRFTRGDLENMLASYAEVVRMQAAWTERQLDQCYFAEQGSSGQTMFLDFIRENIMSFYSSELQWIQKVKKFIAELPEEDGRPTETVMQKENNGVGSTMKYQVLERHGQKYLYFDSSDALIQREQDAVDIISLCVEHDTNNVVLEGDRLSDDFVKLRTGLAGAVLQKWGNYNIKAAVVIKDEQTFPARFRELVSELRTGHTFRIFAKLEEAVDWLFHSGS